jgi:hypothetical protein
MERLLPQTGVDDPKWQGFLAEHPELYAEACWFQALFEDARPGWEGVQTEVRTEAPSAATAFRAAMARALFDDVRPAWEENLAHDADIDRQRVDA